MMFPFSMFPMTNGEERFFNWLLIGMMVIGASFLFFAVIAANVTFRKMAEAEKHRDEFMVACIEFQTASRCHELHRWQREDLIQKPVVK